MTGGQGETEIFVVTSLDGTVTQDVTVDITGSDEVVITQLATSSSNSEEVLLNMNGSINLSNYQGYEFTGFNHYKWGYGDGDATMMYTSRTGTITATDDGNFYLESMSARSYYGNYNATIIGYKDGVIVTSQTIAMTPVHKTYDFGNAWSDIDEVRMVPSTLYIFTDNIALSTGNSNDGYAYLGTAVNDIIVGSESDDILMGLAGNDTLTGGFGDDTFVFNSGGGADIITDFGEGNDVIDLSDFAGYDSLANVKSHSTQTGNDVTIDLGNGNSVTLEGVDLNSLHTDDFLFV